MPNQDAQTNSRPPQRDQSAIRNQKSEILLHRFAILQVIATFLLLALGGTVTSKEVGMSVTDWPQSLGHNMFLLPPSLWQGGIFWEHTHRLVASFVGLIAIVGCVWLWRTQKHRPWLQWVGVAALGLVIIQGVIGGLRVTQDPVHPTFALAMRIVHGIMAQLYLCATVLIAAATSTWWKRAPEAHGFPGVQSVGITPAIALLLVLLVQLTLGAAMRHTGSGLAIPDFPSSYGQIIPPLSTRGIENATESLDLPDLNHGQYFLPGQVAIHFAHRVWAMVVLVAAAFLLVRITPRLQHDPLLTRPAMALAALLVLQIALGVSVIWTQRHPEIATAHQISGAAVLAVTFLLVLRLRRLPLESMDHSAHFASGSVRTLAGGGA